MIYTSIGWRSVCVFAAPLRLENGSTSDAFEQNVYQYESAFCFLKLEQNRFSLLATTDPSNFIVKSSRRTNFCRLSIIPIKIFTFALAKMRMCWEPKNCPLNQCDRQQWNRAKRFQGAVQVSQIHIYSFESVIQRPCAPRMIIIIMDSFVWSSGIRKRTYT